MIGIDQYGNHCHIPGIHPRKELMQICYSKSVNKMYVDTEAGITKHVGYVVGKLWITLYTEWEGGKA